MIASAVDRQHRRQRQQRQGADDPVEGLLDDDVPVGDRLVEQVEHRHLADIGIGARPEAQPVGVGGEADVDRQHPQLAQHLQDALLGGDRQREDDQIDARRAGEVDQIVDVAELRIAFDGVGRALVAAVVEHAEQAHLGLVVLGQFAQQLGAERAAADDHRALLQPPALASNPTNCARMTRSTASAPKPTRNHAAIQTRDSVAVDLEEEHAGEHQGERQRPAAGDAQQRAGRAAEGRRAVDVQRLEDDHGQRRDAERQRQIARLRADAADDVEAVDGDAAGAISVASIARTTPAMTTRDTAGAAGSATTWRNRSSSSLGGAGRRAGGGASSWRS